MTACASVRLLSAVSSPARVVVSRSCPGGLGTANGVSNAYSGAQLVAPNPTSGLICRYTPPYPFGAQPNPDPASLSAQVRLSTSQAVHLSTVIDAINTAVPTGSTSCPPDLRSVSVIAFAYSRGRDIDLWFEDSGCQTLNNGRVEVFEEGNPEFYGAFDPLIEAWAPAKS
jgi:hypothetical protein